MFTQLADQAVISPLTRWKVTGNILETIMEPPATFRSLLILPQSFGQRTAGQIGRIQRHDPLGPNTGKLV